MSILKQTATKTINKMFSLILAVIMLIGTVPTSVFADTQKTDKENLFPEPSTKQLTVNFMGEEIERPKDGIVQVEIDGFDKPIEVKLSEYIYIDGERVSTTDDRIANIVPVIPSSRALGRSVTPNVSEIVHVSSTYTPQGSVNMTFQGRTRQVHPIRYVAMVDGIEYEAFCADPTLPGPEDGNTVYNVTGEIPAVLNVLKNGFPANPNLSDFKLNEEIRMTNVYATRVGVAMANPANSSATFSGDQAIKTQAQGLNSTPQDYDSSHPAIAVNGDKDAVQVKDNVSETLASSEPFVITYNRRSHRPDNPFRFEWGSNTPNGTQLIVNGSVVATSPTQIPTTTYQGDISFQLAMPNTPENVGKEAKVNLVGIHNQYANKVWRTQHPTNPNGWQDIVFFIPPINASATFAFMPNLDQGSLKIIKTDGSKRLAGAEFRIEGPDPRMPLNVTIPSSGEWNSATAPELGSVKTLELGTYTITETKAPNGYEIGSNPTQTAQMVANQTTPVTATFTNKKTTTPDPQTTSVKIQKIDALTRENIPGALMRLRGISADVVVTGGTVPSTGDTHWTLNNTGINLSQVLTSGATTATGDGVKSTVTDGAWTLEGLPYGAYIVEEERAPLNYSLLPQHTSYGFWLLPPDVTVDVIDVNVIQDPDTGAVLETIVDYEIKEDEQVSSILITFENYPFGEITLEKIDDVTGKPVAGARMKIEGYFPEGNHNGIPIDRTETTDAQGKITFKDLPAGNYTIREVWAPEGYLLSNEVKSVPLTWGQKTTVTFVNVPKTTLEVIKVDEFDSSKTLSGARFELKDPTTGETWEGMTGSNGKFVFGIGTGGSELIAGKTYILTELQAPNGYILNDKPIDVVLRNTGLNTITVTNAPKVSLEVLKIDANTSTPLKGAIFTLVDRTNGETWKGTTGADGKATFGIGSLGNELLAGKLYILTEFQAANGYILDTTPHEIILKGVGVNTYTVKNWRNPSLTIVKRDKNNGQQRLEGAVFDVVYENGQTVAGSPFTTNNRGEIVIDEILFENTDERTLIITETIPPDGYNLSTPNWQRVTVKKGEDNVIVFENTRKPTLEIHKVDAINGKNLVGAEFTIEKLEEPGKGMLTGNPFRTDSNGKITLPYQYSGKYKITEIKAPNNYWFNPLEQNRSWIIDVKPNEDYYLRVENTLLPTLIITKFNAVTYKPVPLTHFKVEYEVPNSGNVELVGEFVTNANGQIVLPYVRVGWYKVTETRSAPGMALNTNNSYRIYLSAGNNSYMPIPPVTGNNPNLNPEMPVFMDIKVFGGNDFFVSGLNSENQYDFPDDSLVIKGEPNEVFTIHNADKSAESKSASLGRSFVQIDVNAGIVGEFKADSSGILVIADLEVANYSVIRADGKSKTASVKNDGSVVIVAFSGSGDILTPTPSPTPTPNTDITEEELKNLDLDSINPPNKPCHKSSSVFGIFSQKE